MVRILLIEDDPSMAALMEEWLVRAGYRIEHGDGGETQARGLPRAIVCSTVNLRGPGSARLEALLRRYPRVPVVALSGQQAHSLSGDSARVLRLGVKAVLAKPFGRSELLAALAAALAGG